MTHCRALIGAHLVGVSAELVRVLLDPVEDCELVQQPLVTSCCLVSSAQETQGSQPANNTNKYSTP